MKMETEPKRGSYGADRVATRSLKDIAVAEIDRDPDNRSIEETDERFVALVDSIQVFGVLQRIHVRVHGDRFQLIDGERRYRATPSSAACVPNVWRRNPLSREFNPWTLQTWLGHMPINLRQPDGNSVVEEM